MNPQGASRVWLALLLVVTYTTAIVEASYSGPVGDTSGAGCQNSTGGIRMSGGFKIISVSEPDEKLLLAAQAESYLMGSISDYPQPPLGGSPSLIAIAASDERIYDFLDWEHDLQYSYVGSPLNPPATENFVIGILDSGATVDLVAGSGAETLGVTGDYHTGYTQLIGGIGGTVEADVTWPLGMFAGGLATIDPNGHIDPNQLVGHTNVSILAAPEISCGGGETVTALMGTPFLSFFSAVIRNDSPRRVTVDSETFIGPDIQILQQSDPCIPVYPRSISIEFGGPIAAKTANYYPDAGLETPEIPTLLSFMAGLWPFGGAFFEDIGVLEGEPGSTNPMQTIRVLVDTGAQSSIISEDVAADLNLPTQPDFTVDVCGVGGIVEDVPGYYVDYVKINALGGALEFSNAPFVVMNLTSPEDFLTLDGVLGTNFFWNRNIVFDPNLVSGGYVHVSDPVPFGYVDFDGDKDVDMEDFAIFTSAWQTEPGDADYNPACDVFIDASVDGRDLAAFMQAWLRKY